MNKNKKFFFEKKNQKTLGPLREVVEPSQAQINKVFLLLFVHKKKVFLPRPTFWDSFFFRTAWELHKKRQKNFLGFWPVAVSTLREAEQMFFGAFF